ncbi:MAG: MFS transporter [Burkholderiaceae bacterium]
MPIALYALAMINFAIGTQGFAFAGVLPEMASDLGVSVAQAGWLIAATSITYAIGAPIATGLVGNIERRRIIAIGLAALTLVNLACAFAPSHTALMGLRILAGIATAFAGSLTTVAAASLVSADKRGKAFAIVTGGLTIAFVIGVPLGSVIGGAFDWRATFLFSAAVSVASLALILAIVPRIDPAPGPKFRLSDITSNRPVLYVLALTLLGFVALFTVVAFVGPVVTRMTGATGAGVGAIQVFVGIGSIAGLALGGWLADRGDFRVGTSGVFIIIIATLCSYYITLGVTPGSVPSSLVALQTFTGATALFALVPLNLTEITRWAGTATPIALAVNSSLVALGQGLGAVWGGWLTDNFEMAMMGPGGAVVALVGLAMIALKRKPVLNKNERVS